MKRKFIPADESFARWKKDPKFVTAYNALEGGVCLGRLTDQSPQRSRHDAGTSRAGNGNNAGSRCPP